MLLFIIILAYCIYIPITLILILCKTRNNDDDDDDDDDSIYQNIQILVFCKDLILLIHMSKLLNEYFTVWISQLVNKNIISSDKTVRISSL